MSREPDPEQDRSAMQRLDARHYGDPDNESVDELIGMAPPCSECGSREAARSAHGRDLCEECADDLDGDLEAPGTPQDKTDFGETDA